MQITIKKTACRHVNIWFKKKPSQILNFGLLESQWLTVFNEISEWKSMKMLIQGDVIKNGTTVAVRLKLIFICITHSLRINHISVLPNATTITT